MDSFFYYSNYRPLLSLSGIGIGGIGVGVSDQYSSLVSGSAQVLFQDILSHHNLYGGLAVNGEVEDIGGGFLYLNQKHRINYGGNLSYIPYTYRYSGRLNNDPLVSSAGDTTHTISDNYITDRYAIAGVSGIIIFPLTKTYRFTLTPGFTRYTYNRTIEKAHYSSTTGYFIERSKEKQALFEPLLLFQSGLFFIGDNSTFGYTGPVKGFRFRLGGRHNMINLNYSFLEFDFRKYAYLKPLTFAFRITHYGNYITSDKNSTITDFSLGRIGLQIPVRGYEDLGSFSAEDNREIDYERVYGEKIFFLKSEIRYLIFGTPELGSLARSNALKIQIAPFFDMGFAYADALDEIIFSFDKKTDGRIPITSLGMSSRVNLANILILEFFYSYMFQHPTKDRAFGFNIIPGW